MSTLNIYHGNCADGFASAWVVRKSQGEKVEFFPGVYQQLPPDVKGKNVILTDFSYKRSVMEKMIDEANSVLILDHHKSAKDDLQDLKGAEVVFDMERSGAMITWDYFFPHTDPPRLLLYIQDRDLWRFNLENTREIQANVFSYPYDFQVWDRLMSTEVSDLVAEGKSIERKHHKDVAELLKVVTHDMFIGEHWVKVANLPYTLVSDAAHELAKGKPFGACYWDTPDGRVFGLRSTEEGVDVSEVASRYGGGGHKHAAGFCVQRDVYETFMSAEQDKE